jgi:glycerol-3-phosphate dehydrogenase
MNRKEHLERLKTDVFDVCIIGAGASGAGCALDAQLRGLKVALIEKEDFASQTSSKSTKLIHGGVRYLEQAFKKLDFGALKQVRHGLEERHIVLKNAPHLTRPLALLTPCYSWFEGLYFTIGLRLYGFFAKNDPLPKSKWLSKTESLLRIKGLHNKIHSAVMYYDGQLDDARYCTMLVKTAAEKGAAVCNHLEVIDFQYETNHKIKSVKVKDDFGTPDFEIKAKIFINCTGPFADKIRLKANPDLPKRVTQSKGSHLILPQSVMGTNENAMLIPKTSDGRVVFAIPWEGEILLGTTDTPYTDSKEEPSINNEEINYLLETLNRYLAIPATASQVKAGFSGLRPLLSATGRDTKSLARDHEVEIDEKSGLVSLMGGKWTTYRLMAKDTIDDICKILNINTLCSTENQILAGGAQYNFEDWKKLALEFGIDEDIAQHLMKKYGSRAKVVLAENTPLLRTRLSEKYPYIAAEIAYVAKEEMACTLRDALGRRIRLEFTDWAACQEAIPLAASVMATTLGWDDAEKQQQINTYLSELKFFQSEAKG